MRVLSGEQVLMRVFIGGADKFGNQPLYKALVEMFRREKLAGATVLRGILGYGAASHLHTANLLRLSRDLPIVIEIVDSREKIDRILPEIERMMGEGLITMEKVVVMRYGNGEGGDTDGD